MILPLGKLNVKNGPSLADILVFSIILVSSSFFVFIGVFSFFFSKCRHPRHPVSLPFLTFFLTVG